MSAWDDDPRKEVLEYSGIDPTYILFTVIPL